MSQKGKSVLVFCSLLILMAGNVRADLMAQWRLDDGQGSIALDSSGNDRHAEMVGAPIWVQGLFDGALQASLGNYLVVPGYTGVLGAEPRTCTAWIKTETAPGVLFGWGLITNGTKWIVRINQNGGELRAEVDGGYHYGTTPLIDNEWHHVAAVLTAEAPNVEDVLLYVDGVHDASSADISPRAINTIEDMDVTLGQNPHSLGSRWYDGLLDDMRIYNQALTVAELQAVMLGKGPGISAELAGVPSPDHEGVDILREVVLSWSPGDFAATHNVYLGLEFYDVNTADVADPLGVLVSQGQNDTHYDAGVLEFGQTYYWRVDEVNGAPDNTVFKGEVWCFEVESFAIPVTNVTASASSAHDADMQPEKTIDGSGMDAQDQHSTEPKDMWLSGMGDPEPSIQYAFDRAYKLHEMWVWNSNQLIEGFVGLGAKDVTVEVSNNGTDWTLLEGTPQFAQAPGRPGYAHNTTVDLGAVMAKYVKLIVKAGYGMLPQHGLSELRFLSIPTSAREPHPADAAVADSVDVVLSWRAGREAASHEVYLGTDSMDLGLLRTVAENRVAIGPLDYATTYYWQIVEVNAVETPTSSVGDVWSFTTPAYGIVDDFDQYDDDCNRIFFAWLDGLGHNGGEDIDDCDVAPYNGNGSGSIVGHANAPFAEQVIVHSGRQSMPLEYDGGVSETTIALGPQDWTTSGIQSLSLQFYGSPGNTGQLYLKINDSKIAYEGLAHALERQQWFPWNIDLATTGANLSNVTSLSLGIEGASAPGVIFVDEIRLYPLAPETVEPVIPDADDPSLVAYYEFEGNAGDTQGNYPGTAEGAPTYTAGKIGQAINLDEVDDNVVHALAQEEVWPAYTVSLWVKTDLMGQDTNSSLFNNNSSSSDFQIEVDGNDDYLYRGSSNGLIGPVSNNWVHIGVSCDGARTRLYYNGLLTESLNVADTNFGQLAVGINRGMANRFGGVIDEVKVYNRALSDGEIAGLAGITTTIDKPFAE
jgi:hypothetical protein